MSSTQCCSSHEQHEEDYEKAGALLIHSCWNLSRLALSPQSVAILGSILDAAEELAVVSGPTKCPPQVLQAEKEQADAGVPYRCQ